MRDFDTNKAAIKALLDEGDLLSVDAKMDCFQDLEINQIHCMRMTVVN